MSTSQPDLMIELNKLITKKGSFFADAPIARTRQAAKDGTLAIMVGSKKEVYKRIFLFWNIWEKISCIVVT